MSKLRLAGLTIVNLASGSILLDCSRTRSGGRKDPWTQNISGRCLPVYLSPAHLYVHISKL